jgi:hypothetical protein
VVPLPPGYVLVDYPKDGTNAEYPVALKDLPAAKRRGAVVVWPKASAEGSE